MANANPDAGAVAAAKRLEDLGPEIFNCQTDSPPKDPQQEVDAFMMAFRLAFMMICNVTVEGGLTEKTRKAVKTARKNGHLLVERLGVYRVEQVQIPFVNWDNKIQKMPGGFACYLSNLEEGPGHMYSRKKFARYVVNRILTPEVLRNHFKDDVALGEFFRNVCAVFAHIGEYGNLSQNLQVAPHVPPYSQNDGALGSHVRRVICGKAH